MTILRASLFAVVITLSGGACGKADDSSPLLSKMLRDAGWRVSVSMAREGGWS